MKDYTGYYTSSIDKIIEDSEIVLNMNLDGGDGRDAFIDTVSDRIIVKNHTNPINQSKYDKKCLFKKTSNVHCGSIVSFDDYDWLVISDVLDKTFYYKASVLKCKYYLKFIDQNSIINEIVSVPCVVGTNSEFSLENSITENKFFITQDGSLTIRLPFNIYTQQLYEKQRFIFGRKVLHIAGINDVENVDYVNNTGYLTLTMQITEKDPRDDFETGIAWNDGITLNSYEIAILSSDLELGVNETLTLSPVVKNNGIVVEDLDLVYESSDEDICTISENGVITCISEGECTITVSLEAESSINTTINITVVQEVADNFVCVINGANQILKNKTGYFSCSFSNNGVSITRESTFWLTDDSGNALSSNIAVIESQSSVGNICTVKCGNPSGVVYFKLWCKDVDEEIFSEFLRIKIYSLI